MKNNIVLLDFWTDKNRGDAAMQLSQIELTKKKYPNSKITIVTGYGANQIHSIENELDLTTKKIEDGTISEIVGGLKPTYFKLQKNIANKFIVTRLLFELIAMIKSLFLLLALIVKIPNGLIRVFLRKKYNYTFNILVKADLIVWNGRNFRGDSWLKEPYDIFNLLYNPLVCIFLKKKIVNIGSSVWPLHNKLSVKMLSYSFSKCNLVTIREHNSFSYIKSTLKKSDNVKLLPDLSFYLIRNLVKEYKITRNTDSSLVGLTVVDWRNDGQEARNNYINSLIEFVGYLIGLGKKILVIPQVTYKVEKTDAINTILVNNYGENIEFINENLDIKGLLDVYSSLDLLVATRMHSSIFAQSIYVPTISIAYDKGGKWGILDMMNVGETIIDITDVTKSKLIDKYNYLISNNQYIQTKLKEGISFCFDNVDKNFNFGCD